MANIFARQKTTLVIYAIALAGVVVNLLYFGVQFLVMGKAASELRTGLPSHAAVFSLIFLFPAFAMIVHQKLPGDRLSDRCRLLELELAASNRELQELKTFTENILASVNDLIFVIGTDGRFQFVGGNSQKVMGYEPEKLMGRQFIDMVAPGSVAIAVNNFEKIMWGDEVEPHELEVTDGEDVRRMRISTTAYRKDGRVIAQVGVASEIVPRRDPECDACESSRKLTA